MESIPEKETSDVNKTALEGEDKRTLQSSLSNVEKAVLRAFQVDINDFDQSSRSMASQKKKTANTQQGDKEKKIAIVSAARKKRMKSKNHIGLWKAFEDGVKPSTLRNLGSTRSETVAGPTKNLEELDLSKASKKAQDPVEIESISESNVSKDVSSRNDSIDVQVDESDIIPSDEEICATSNSDKSTASSWDDVDGGIGHYDAWQVMKDEYAIDAGFSYLDEESTGVAGEGLFRIIGTSADDKSCMPHVMSPPLLESLLNFVPDHLAQENLWLKFSMTRDGASINTLRVLCKNSQHTFLAIETTEGDVFGAFTASPWHKTYSFFGTGESFLWKMRYNRMTPCHSLVEQAQLEGDVDIFPFSGLNNYVQLCHDNVLAVGGGSLDKTLDSTNYSMNFDEKLIKALISDENFGFGIAINEDLSSGSTSPCGTFTNPSLIGHSGESQVFNVLNLEIWAFTPCATVKEAEQLETMKAWRAESFLESGSLSVRSTHSIDSKKTGISFGLSETKDAQDYLKEL